MLIGLFGYIVGAEENKTLNETESPNITAIINISPIETSMSDPKFRVGPTVTLRPVNDVIDKSQDGLVELYMNNPSINDVTLTADVQISVPSGIHVYGEGFGYGGAAGTVAGKFEVPPGTVRTIYINIKAEKVGDFTVHFTGLYWPSDNKDAFQQISLTHPIAVNEPSSKPFDPKLTDGNPNLLIGFITMIIEFFKPQDTFIDYKPSQNNFIIINNIIKEKENIKIFGIVGIIGTIFSITFFIIMLIFGPGGEERADKINKKIVSIKNKLIK